MSGLRAPESRVIVRVDMEFKNQHTFSNGMTIRLERQWNNLDKKHTEPVNGIVIHGGGIPEGAEVLMHHNSCHPVAEIFNYHNISGGKIAEGIKHFSVPETQCYLWRNGGAWQPLRGFATALRIFQPIQTQFYGIAPQLIKNTLFITSGEFDGQVVRTVRAADYVIIFRNEKGIEEQIIRCRHFENEINEREEIIAIDHDLTQKVHAGEYLIGLTATDCKVLNEENLYA